MTLEMDQETFAARLDDGTAVVVDVREPHEYHATSIAGGTGAWIAAGRPVRSAA